MRKSPAIKSVKPNMMDRFIGFFNPKMALDRLRFRAISGFMDGTTGYITGGSTRRSVRGWNPMARSADDDVLPHLQGLRASSRDLCMNTPVAIGALRRVNANVIGSGLTLQARVDRKALGLSDEAADAWEEQVEREWKRWSESKDCDITRKSTFAELQQLAFLSTLMNGDCFIVLPYKEVKNSEIAPFQLRLQLIEADQISNPLNKPDSDNLKSGIELDDNGAPVKYHIQKTFHNSFSGIASWTSIDAYGANSGRKNILHLMEMERIGQRRGVPLLAPVIEPLKQATRFSEAELMAAVISAFFTVFVKTTTGAGGLQPSFTADESILVAPDGSTGATATNTDNNLMELGNGNILELDEDQDISIADSKRPNQQFDPFFSSIMKQVGSALEIPYEQLMMMFTSSYSASRAALLEAWKMYRRRRTWAARNMCQPVYKEWLTEAIIRGRVTAPGFFDDPAIMKAWCGSAWGGPGQGQIDPTKETTAAKDRIAANLSTYEDEYVAISGGDWESAMERKARENRILEKNNLSAVTPEAGEPVEPGRTDEADEEEIEE